MDYRSPSRYPADTVYATMVDPDYLTARLARLGGPGARLTAHRADAHSARYSLRHGLSADDLPPVVAALLPGDILIERTETLHREEVGRYSGDVEVSVPGTPASATGWMRLADSGPSGSELHVHADVTVHVPLFGGRIEVLIAEQIRKMLAAETSFTLDWLNRSR